MPDKKYLIVRLKNKQTTKNTKQYILSRLVIKGIFFILLDFLTKIVRIAFLFIEILNLKDKGLKSVVVCTLGYRHEEDKYAHAEKVRYSTEDVFITI